VARISAWTRHRLSATHLQLHYGLDFKVSIPRAHIVSVERARERVVMPVARYEAEKQRLNIAFSEHGQLLLRLDTPYPFQIGFGKKVFAEKILLNVNLPDELVIIGPLASLLGKLYRQAFYMQEGRSGARAVLMLPGVRLLSAWLSRYRTLTGALLYKGLLNQSRNVFTWGRTAILVICIALFPLLEQVMISYGFSPVSQVTVYSSIVAIIAVVEYAAYAISSEGARMSYYLLAPFGMATYLRARLVGFLLPVLTISLVVCCITSWWLRLTIYEAGMAALLMALLLVGYTACIVWGSVFDLDINQLAEGAMQNLMQEELPVTPRRLQLLGISFLLLAGMILLILKLPVVLSILALVLLDRVICVGLWRSGLARLKRLITSALF